MSNLIRILFSLTVLFALSAQAERQVATDEESGTFPAAALGMPAPQPKSPPHPVMGMPALPHITCTTTNGIPHGAMGMVATVKWSVRIDASRIFPMQNNDKVNGVDVLVWNNFTGSDKGDDFTAAVKRVDHSYTLTNKSKGFVLYISAINSSGAQSFTGHLTYHVAKGAYVTEGVTCNE